MGVDDGRCGGNESAGVDTAAEKKPTTYGKDPDGKSPSRLGIFPLPCIAWD